MSTDWLGWNCKRCGQSNSNPFYLRSEATAARIAEQTKTKHSSQRTASQKASVGGIIGLLVVGALVWGICASVSSGGGGAGSNGGSHENPSVAYKLAVIDGDPSEEADFQDVIDCIMSSGIKGAETEERVGDTLVASLQEGGKQGSLLAWGRTLCNA